MMFVSAFRPLGAAAVVACTLALAACTQRPAPVTFIAEGNPEKLSDWHLMAVSGGRLNLNKDVVPYDLNTALFTDYAQKLRTIWMPKGQSAVYNGETTFDFP